MQEIVAALFAQGKLITPAALERAAGQEIVPATLAAVDHFIVTENDIDLLMRQPRETVTIVKNLTAKPHEVSTNDFVRFSATKYERLREIITERAKKPFVSINAVTDGPAFVIGIVRDAGHEHIELEDLTGTLTAAAPAALIRDLEPDDVIGVQGTRSSGVFTVERIMLPDVPLRAPATGHGKACFISDLHLNEAARSDAERFFRWFEKSDIRYLFVAGDIGDIGVFDELVETFAYAKRVFAIAGEADDGAFPQLAPRFTQPVITALSNPATVMLNGVTVLMAHDADLRMIKKRYLGKGVIHADHLVIDSVPDIVHCGHTHEGAIMNYKSVTMVNSGSLLTTFRPVVIDFASREAQLINLPASV